MNILDIAITKQLVGGGGSGTDNYNDLSNLPQINGETLSGNKSAENLGLQDALTFDSSPTEESTNPVESGGVYTALAGKQDNLTFDDDPTENSTNPVKSGGVYSALAGKQDNLTFDGDYNASTNKAATESTVTNAIAGLDVSAISVDADETISSISETDGKISVTKQDIAIASNQVTAMTGYTKPSSTPATPAIQTSDTANQAFGKLEFKADTNQTNILYALNKVGKNLFDFKTWVKSLTGAAGGYFTYTDNSITLTATSSYASTQPATGGFHVSVKPLTQYVLVFTGYDANGAITILKNDTYSGYRTFNTTVGDNVIEITTDGDTTLWSIRFDVTAINLSSTISNVMIIPKEVYDAVGGDYQPYGAPNSDLTRLQSEDRAALVECVDEGAKNLWDFANAPYGQNYNETHTKTDTSITVTSVNTAPDGWSYASYGLPLKAGRYVFSATISDLTSPTGSLQMIRVAGGINGSDSKGQYNISANGDISFEFQITQDGMYYVLFASNYVLTPYIASYTATNLMVSTKAKYDIAPSYEPYTLPNYDLTRLEAEDRASLAEVVDSGAKNLINIADVTTAGAGFVFDVTSIDSLPSGSYIFSYISNQVEAGNIQLVVRNGNTVLAEPTILSKSGRNLIPFTISSTANTISLYSACAGTYSDFMLCTKAAFDVSPQFVPYKQDPFYQIPINHNMIYRGQNLGDTLTDAQHTALSSGNFTDLYLGDYWTKAVTIPAFYEVTTAEPANWSTNYTSYYTKSGDTYTPVSGDTAPTWAANTYYERLVPAQIVMLKAVIADFDTFYGGYNSSHATINSHHAAIIVTGFSNVVWNSTNTTDGGYVNSLIHKWLVSSVLPQMETWFGSAKVLSHQKLLTNAITGDAASGWVWSSQKISLLSENQMYGSKVWGNSKTANGGYEPGEAFKHLSVFTHIAANLLFGDKSIWLRDIASAEKSAYLNADGAANLYEASGVWLAPAAFILLS